ncbi:hypothetical protein Lal_00048593 [Lupinus albus]|nr:hypothetical protein Lal_00048593 [Lupinus albus]
MKRSVLKEMRATASYTGGAWLSSARVVRCWTADYTSEEGEDDVKSSCLLRPGLHTCYNGYNKKLPVCKNELIFKYILSSDCRLKLVYMKVESLVIAGQLYCGESVLGPCTHRPSHHGS